MRTHARPQSAIKYEPSGYKRVQNSNECQMVVLDSMTQISNKMSRPISAFSNRPKFNSTSMLEKPHNETKVLISDSRTTPRYIKKDKEELYQELLQLQQKYNQSTDDNTKMKTQIQQLQKEVSKLTDLVQNVEFYVNKSSNHINTYHLKQKIKDLKNEIEKKDEELKEAKYNTKATKIEELRIQLKESHTESLRIRVLLDQQVRGQAMMQFNDLTLIEEKMYIQSQMLNQLKADNDQLIGLLKIQEDESNYYRDLLGETLKTVRKYEETIDDLHKNLKGKGQFMDKLATKIEVLKGQNNNLQGQVVKVDDCKGEIRDMKRQQTELEKAIVQLRSTVEYQNGMIQELNKKNAEKSIYEQREKKLFEDQIAKMSQQYDFLDDKYRNLLLIQQQSKMKETIGSYVIRKEQTVGNPLRHNMDSYQQQQQYVPKKLRAVRMGDVKNIGIELNYRFRLKKITLSDVIEQYLFDDDNKKRGTVNLKQLQLRFQAEPFLLLDQDKSMLLARYLVEDNTSDFVEFNIEQYDSLVRVRSIFNKLIANYKLFTIEEERRLKEEITPIIQKYKQSLKQHFDQMPSLNGDLTKEQLVDTFIFMDIDLNQDQLEYFILRLFALSNRIDRFPYNKIFEIFQPTQMAMPVAPLNRERTQKRKVDNKLFDTKSIFKQQVQQLQLNKQAQQS